MSFEIVAMASSYSTSTRGTARLRTPLTVVEARHGERVRPGTVPPALRERYFEAVNGC